jgi:hypothetical protein
VAVHGDYLYYVGGNNTAATPGSTSTVFFTSFNSTGTLAAWSSTTPLPRSYANFSAAAYNGYLYSVGGFNVEDNAGTTTVWLAPINSTGSIGSWTSTAPLPHRIQHHNLAVNNGFMYVIGGSISGGGGRTSTALFARILPDGHLTPWAETKALPSAGYAAGTRAANGVLYLAGGFDAADAQTTTVRMTELPDDPVYWGLEVPGGTAAGTYSGTITYTAEFSP